MPSLPPALLLALTLSSGIGSRSAIEPVAASSIRPASSALPGREEDGRVARIAFRLALGGRARCPAPAPASGLVLQHLTQFALADRAGVLAALPLDRGPAAIAVVPESPAAVAGILPGDVVLAIDGAALPPEPARTAPFSAATAHARADSVEDLLAHDRPLTLTLLRDGQPVSVRLVPQAACPSRVFLARSAQRNAYADGRHVFLTTGLVSLLRNDDELAFLVAHEMAHNILGHATVMRSDAVSKGLGRTFGRSGAIVRGTETSADALGATLMLDSGYDPVRGAAILERLGGSDFGIALFATHEPVGKRLAAIAAVAAARHAR